MILAKKHFTILLGVLLAVTAVFGVVSVVNAAGILPEPHGKCPEDYNQPGGGQNGSGPCASGGPRDYALDDFKGLIINAANYVIGISGAVLLVLLVYGSFLWIASAGNTKMVDQGKGILTAAAVGMLIILVSYTAVAYGLKIYLNAGGTGSNEKEFLPKTVGPNNLSSTSGGSGDAGAATGGGSGAINSTKGTILGYKGDATTVCDDLINQGQCVEAGKCADSVSIGGACSGAQDCCAPIANANGNSSCAKIGGACLNYKTAKCDGGVWIQSLCDKSGQGNNIVCCIK